MTLPVENPFVDLNPNLFADTEIRIIDNNLLIGPLFVCSVTNCTDEQLIDLMKTIKNLLENLCKIIHCKEVENHNERRVNNNPNLIPFSITLENVSFKFQTLFTVIQRFPVKDLIEHRLLFDDEFEQ